MKRFLGLLVASLFLMTSVPAVMASQTAPMVEILSPKPGQVVNAWVSVTGVAADQNGNATLRRVQVSLDGSNWTLANGTTSWSLSISTKQVPDGNLTIHVQAIDKKGHTSTDSVVVMVRNHATVVNIFPMCPSGPCTVRGTVHVKGNASDEGGAHFIHFIEVCVQRVGNHSDCHVANGTTHWTWQWPTSGYPDGFYTLVARAHGPGGFGPRSSLGVKVSNYVRPTLTIETPAEGEVFDGSFLAEGTAFAYGGRPVSMEAYIDDAPWRPVAWNTSGRWEFWVEAGEWGGGEHVLTVLAHDGVSGIASQRRFVLDLENRLPRVVILRPADGDVVSGILLAEGRAYDDDGQVRLVQARVDGVGENAWRNLTQTTNWTYSFDTEFLEDGPHNLSVRAWDGQDWSAVEQVSIVVQNEPPNFAPLVNVTRPLDGQTVRGRFTVAGEAYDPDGDLLRIEVFFDGTTTTVAGVWSSWSVQVDSSSIAYGPRVIQVRAFDGEAWSEPVALVVVVDNRPDYVVERIRVDSFQSAVPVAFWSINVTVANRGPGPASNTTLEVWVEATMEPPLLGPSVTREFLGYFQVPPLMPGQTWVHAFPWDTEGNFGDQQVIARVDPGDDWDEVDETNNTRSQYAVVGVGGFGGIAGEAGI